MQSQKFLDAVVFLSKSKDEAREKWQAMNANKIKQIIGKLNHHSDLSEEDIKNIRYWIVGEAESYAKMENNFNDWVKELERLVAVIKEYESKNLSEDDLIHIQGILLEDAERVCADIGNYLEKKESIKRFEQAISNPQSIDYQVLIHILNAKLKSPNM